MRTAFCGARTHCAMTSIVPPRMSAEASPCQRPSQERRHSGGLKLPRVVSAAVSSMHTFSATGGSGMGAPYAGVMNTAVAGNLSGAVAPAGGGVVAGGGLGGAVAGSGSPLGLGAQGSGSTTDTVNGNFSLNKMAEENSKLLNLQAAIQQESQTFTAISNVMKSRNDTIKNSIGNVR